VRACYGVETPNLNRHRPNKYAGPCAICGSNVEQESGRVDKNKDGKWVVTHLEGQCPPRTGVGPTDRDQGAWPKVDAPKFREPAIEQDFSQIPRGHYATKSLTGNNDYDFWRVDRPEQGTYAGRTFVKRIVGGKPDLNVSKSTRIQALGAILREGIDETGTRYGQELGQCRACNRRLTDETSRALGIGPECRAKKGR
jgi:hypothetical protein